MIKRKIILLTAIAIAAVIGEALFALLFDTVDPVVRNQLAAQSVNGGIQEFLQVRTYENVRHWAHILFRGFYVIALISVFYQIVTLPLKSNSDNSSPEQNPNK